MASSSSSNNNHAVPDAILNNNFVVSRLSNQNHVSNPNGDGSEIAKKAFFDAASRELLQLPFKDKENPSLRHPQWIPQILFYASHPAALASDLNRYILEKRNGLHSQEKGNVGGIWKILEQPENVELMFTTYIAIMGAARDLTRRAIPFDHSSSSSSSSSSMPISLEDDGIANPPLHPSSSSVNGNHHQQKKKGGRHTKWE